MHNYSLHRQWSKLPNSLYHDDWVDDDYDLEEDYNLQDTQEEEEDFDDFNIDEKDE